MEYKNSFDLFQKEIKNLLSVMDRQAKEIEGLNAQILISNQIKEEILKKEAECARIYEGEIRE
jgi:hypothetical protein